MSSYCQWLTVQYLKSKVIEAAPKHVKELQFKLQAEQKLKGKMCGGAHHSSYSKIVVWQL
jgi:hypothetical protein